MSPRSVRLLETSIVSAFVSFGVAAAVLLGMAGSSPAPGVAPSCASQDVLAPLLRAAIEADAELSSRDGGLDEVEAARVESLYTWYVGQHEKLAETSDLEWARSRAEGLRQLQADLAQMRALEAEARALEAESH